MPNPLPLSLTDWLVLGLVVEEPRHGFALARELQADAVLGQVWSVHRPLVYRAVEHLGGLGLIEPTRTEPGEQGPRRVVYRATPAGRRRFRAWLARPVDHPRDARTELLAKLVFLGRRGESLAPLARAQLERFGPVATGLASALDDATGPERLIARWRLETIEATNATLRAVVADA